MKKFLVSYRLKGYQETAPIIYESGFYSDTFQDVLNTLSIFLERTFEESDQIVISFNEKE